MNSLRDNSDIEEMTFAERMELAQYYAKAAFVCLHIGEQKGMLPPYTALLLLKMIASYAFFSEEERNLWWDWIEKEAMMGLAINNPN